MLVGIFSFCGKTFGDFCEYEPDLCSECRELAYCQTKTKDAVIPQNLSRSTLYMDILYVGNESVSLHSRMFDRYRNLTKLTLLGRGIGGLEVGVFQSLHKLQNLAIFGTSVNYLPERMIPPLSQIKVLDLHNNRLKRIPHHLFKDTPELTDLNLGFNSIIHQNCSTIGWTFKTLKKLRKFELSKFFVPEVCKLEIPSTFFEPIQYTVESLNLTVANVYGGSEKIFKGFTALTELDISVAKTFVDCPSLVSKMFGNLPPSLHTLVMRRWRTDGAMTPECTVNSSTLASLKSLPKLARLDMKYGDLFFGEKLKRSIFSGFKFLKELNIGYARFSSVEDYVFDGCPNLTFVTMDGNPVGIRPFKLFQNRSYSKLEHIKLKRTNIFSDYSINYHAAEILIDAPLRILDLRQNWLVKMPLFINNKSVADDFGSLETIRLDTNYLTELESGGNLTSQCNFLYNLHRLTLSNNRIRKVQGLCSSIVTLNLAFNNLYFYWDSINEGVISKLTNLKILDLSFNQIRSLSANLFSQIKNLTELYLRGNNLTTIDSSSFIYNPYLEILDFRANALLEIKTSLIEHLQCIKELLVEDNDITLVDPNLILYFDNQTDSIKKFGLIGNPFLCSCTQQFFQKWIHSTNIVPFANELECSAPPELKSQKVYAYKRDTYDCDYKEIVNAIISVLGGILAAVTVVLPCYKYRWYLTHARVVVRAVLTQLPTVRAELRCSYDAYVMYNSASDEDLNWVTQDLRLALETDILSTDQVNVIYTQY